MHKSALQINININKLQWEAGEGSYSMVLELKTEGWDWENLGESLCNSVTLQFSQEKICSRMSVNKNIDVYA